MVYDHLLDAVIVLESYRHRAAGIETAKALDAIIRIRDFGGIVLIRRLDDNRVFLAGVGLRADMDAFEAFEAPFLIAYDLQDCHITTSPPAGRRRQ